MLDSLKPSQESEVILQPKPSTNPNDPLVGLPTDPSSWGRLRDLNKSELAPMAQIPEFRTRLLLRDDGPSLVSVLFSPTIDL